eukprot:CAMPEP_0176088326 /NCGR_PEP_ID=MMETSP0120_2-20121206/44226_1 /TAXON_ID=160619 /ORGANISM="Kryptoperidinium foliaceum, Strain CCMP 1326" /LENGTH=162 /DNA_ID=CAMNT_0017422185 /DNA_START=150 /DNA_END=636 /DNA_ORIENTATION=-
MPQDGQDEVAARTAQRLKQLVGASADVVDAGDDIADFQSLVNVASLVPLHRQSLPDAPDLQVGPLAGDVEAIFMSGSALFIVMVKNRRSFVDDDGEGDILWISNGEGPNRFRKPSLCSSLPALPSKSTSSPSSCEQLQQYMAEARDLQLQRWRAHDSSERAW